MHRCAYLYSFYLYCAMERHTRKECSLPFKLSFGGMLRNFLRKSSYQGTLWSTSRHKVKGRANPKKTHFVANMVPEFG